MSKSKVVMLIASVLGTIAVVVCFLSINRAMSIDGAESIYPHIPPLALSAIATIFAWATFGTGIRNYALIAGILYATTCAFEFGWFVFVVVPMTLSFVAFVMMEKKKNGKAEEEK